MQALKQRQPWRPPPRLIPPAKGFLVDGDTFVVPGVAVVFAYPHRSRADARGFAERIVRDPATYLAVLVGYEVPGVIDRRPVSHVHGGTPFTFTGKAVDHA